MPASEYNYGYFEFNSIGSYVSVGNFNHNNDEEKNKAVIDELYNHMNNLRVKEKYDCSGNDVNDIGGLSSNESEKRYWENSNSVASFS